MKDDNPCIVKVFTGNSPSPELHTLRWRAVGVANDAIGRIKNDDAEAAKEALIAARCTRRR